MAFLFVSRARVAYPEGAYFVRKQRPFSGGNIMPVRSASAVWEGDLARGKGFVEVGSGHFKGEYSVPSRFENGPGTNPEELIGAAHAGCFSMALSGILGRAGFKPRSIATQAKVHIEKVGDGFQITKIELHTKGVIPDIDASTFQKHANEAKTGCPVSKALTGTTITLQAELAG
jgi:osmotically inducible protein OsmC